MHNRFPVLVYDRDARSAYKNGGLAAKAQDVADAGRYDDTHLIHVTDDELDMLRQQWGDPSINPHTGIPEFGIFGSILKVIKKVAPIAVSFIPGVGPIASAALGAGLGALDGGGLKGALLGGATGALGGAGAAGKIGGTLAKGASAATQKMLGDAVIGGALGAATGQNPLQAALMAGGTSFLRGQFEPKAATPPPANTSAAAIPTAAPATMALPNSQAEFDASFAAKPTVAAPVAATQPNWWNRDVGFLGKLGTDLGIKNKHAALVGGLLAAGAVDALKPKEDTSMPSQSDFFGPSFSQSSLGTPGGFKLASVSSGVAPESAASEYAKKYYRFAVGGDVGGEGRSGHSSFAVNGPGTGRSDEIPAMLSDGEYVMDAETVALLGDGSSKAGAKKLDDLRVKIRKHKGKQMAKGKFSRDAKPVEKYMAGGRI